MRFPGNVELKSGILTKDAYAISPQPRLVDILWELEQATRTNLAEKNDRPASLWVEHVLPRTWTEEWPFDGDEYAAPDSDLPQAILRKSVLNSLGNLTLVTPGLNISAGNQSFAAKQTKFADHTGLFLNKWFGNQQKWSEAEINERGEHLAALAVSIWPELETYS